MEREAVSMATCHQLAGLVEDDWEFRKPNAEVEQALKVMHSLDEPDSASEKRDVAVVILNCAVEALKKLLQHSDDWNSEIADMVKKELVCRVKQYEKRIKQFTTPLLDLGPFKFES